MTNLLLIIVVLSSLVAACKYRPNQVRSSLQSKNIYQFVEEGSVRFYRNADASKADLQFNLLNHYECIVSFWSDDINVEPNEDAPKYQSCVKGDQSIRMSFDELNPEATYAVKISIWPARLSSLTSANLILREGEDLKDVNSNNLIIANFLTPRQTGEIYSFGFQGQKSLQDVRNEIITSYAGKLGVPIRGLYGRYLSTALGPRLLALTRLRQASPRLVQMATASVRPARTNSSPTDLSTTSRRWTQAKILAGFWNGKKRNLIFELLLRLKSTGSRSRPIATAI